MSAMFRVTPLTDGYYQFHLFSGRGEMLLTSQEFSDRETAEQAIQDVRVGSLMSQQIAKAKTPGGDFFFLVKDPGGEVIARSELFGNEMSFDNALHNFRDNACVAEIAYTG